MATLTIRDFPDHLRDRLRVRAAEAGRSMEAEVRVILGQSLGPTAEQVQDRLTAWHELQRIVRANYRPVPGEQNAVEARLRDRRRENILELIKDGDHPRDVFGAAFEQRCSEAGWTAAQVDAFVRAAQERLR